MSILVTGAMGQLGQEICKCLEKAGIPFKGVDLADFDLTDEKATRNAILSAQPDEVIHCAAYTAVDKAETEKDICYKINVLGTAHVAKACKAINAKMMYISTDYVFDGQGDAPFEIDSPVAPVNYYGITKAQGETEVTSCLEKYFIVRISWAFGIGGNNFVQTMLRLGAQHESVRVVGDQIGSPTYVNDLAPLLCEMIQTEKYGVYHVTNEGYCSWFEFAKFIIAEANLTCNIIPIASKDYPTPAKRPYNSRLSKACLDKSGFHRLLPWQDAVIRYITQLKR